jgi:hypothetical protein
MREKWRRGVEKHELTWMEGAAPLDPSEWKRLSRKFGSTTWAGRSLYALVKEVEDLWTDPNDRRLLLQQHDLVNAHNIALITRRRLVCALPGRGLTRASRSKSGRRAFTSRRARGCVLNYANMASLVLKGSRRRP